METQHPVSSGGTCSISLLFNSIKCGYNNKGRRCAQNSIKYKIETMPEMCTASRGNFMVMNETDSYIFGLLLADGNMYLNTRNRGRISIEVSIRDEDIIEKLAKEIPSVTIKRRIRNSNFLKNYTSICLTNYQILFRENLIQCGFPVKDKTKSCCAPTVEYSKRGFWRGVIDGDGSLGLSINGPFISLVTASEQLKEDYLSFLNEEFGIIKSVNRNARDGVYNIMVGREDAIKLAKYLYTNSKLHIDRKYKSYLSMLDWVRTTKKSDNQHVRWNLKEDEYILSHTTKESVLCLKRTEKSVLMRLWRLNSFSSRK